MCSPPANVAWTQRHMWVEFVVGSLLAARGFSPGTPVFLSPQKPTFSKFQFNPEFEGHMFVSRKTVRCYPKVDFFLYLMFVAYSGLHKNCCSVVKEKQKLKHSQKDVL